MTNRDVILDGSRSPTYDEITCYISQPRRTLWHRINSFLREGFSQEPRITYSKCAAKPGWNVKYRRSGTSLCTLYPEREGFAALVVLPLDLMPQLEALRSELEPEVIDVIESTKPFNNTLWLMIPVKTEPVLEDTQKLILLKQRPGKQAKP